MFRAIFTNILNIYKIKYAKHIDITFLIPLFLDATDKRRRPTLLHCRMETFMPKKNIANLKRNGRIILQNYVKKGYTRTRLSTML